MTDKEVAEMTEWAYKHLRKPPFDPSEKELREYFAEKDRLRVLVLERGGTIEDEAPCGPASYFPTCEGTHTSPRYHPEAVVPESSGPWSKPDSPSRWAKVFKMSPRTFKRHVKSGAILANKLSDRSYQIAVASLPSGHK